MPHVTVNYEMFLPGGHHRQPRNTSIELNLAPTAGSDTPNGGFYAPPFFPQLPYSPAAGDIAQLLFWSVTDGAHGQVLPPASFNQQVGGSDLTITGWYYPFSGSQSGGGGSTSILDDAFSANLGRFVDDTFVDVTSDPSLTSDANVIGTVPTKVDETLVAKSSVPSTMEPFSQWLLNYVQKPANETTLQVPKGTTGIAVAIYQQPTQGQIANFDHNRYAIWQWVDYATMVDGGPHPWNPFVNQFMGALALAGAAKGFDEKVRGELVRVALDQIKVASAAIQNAIQSSIR